MGSEEEQVRNRIVFMLPFLQFIIALITLWRIENPPVMTSVCQQQYDGTTFCYQQK